jgi:hypothetical protein|nr:MAG TPA: hypothetical protein [Caudoviricetes sp.]
MKTVFKVGMVVYDQLNFPDKEGKVVDICKDELVTSPITVIFKDRYDGEIERYYTLDGRYKTGELTVLSTKPYQIILQGFEQKAPAPTFEEAWGEAERIYEPKSEYDKEEFGGYPSQDLANAAEALRRLLFLRDYYNEGWQPDWKDNGDKHCIILYKGEFTTIGYSFTFEVLHFKTKEIRDKFLEEQKELLEIAKPLL